MLLQPLRMSLARFKSPLAVIGVDDTLEQAAKLMRDRHVGSLVVTRAGRPAGVITDRDIVVRAVAEGRDVIREKVGSFVTYDPVTVLVSNGIETVASRMRLHGVRRMPIVDETGAAVGIVTADDLLVLLGGEMASVCGGIEHRADADESR